MSDRPDIDKAVDDLNKVIQGLGFIVKAIEAFPEEEYDKIQINHTYAMTLLCYTFNQGYEALCDVMLKDLIEILDHRGNVIPPTEH